VTPVDPKAVVGNEWGAVAADQSRAAEAVAVVVGAVAPAAPAAVEWHAGAVVVGFVRGRLGTAVVVVLLGSRAADGVIVGGMRLVLSNVGVEVTVVQGEGKKKVSGAVVAGAVAVAVVAGIAAVPDEDPVEVGLDSDAVHNRAVMAALSEVGTIGVAAVYHRGHDPACVMSTLHGRLVVVA